MSDDTDDFEARLGARARERWVASTEVLIEREPPSDSADDEALFERTLDRLGARRSVVPIRSRRAWITGVSALAAAVLVAVVSWPRDATLPAYEERAFAGGVARVRSEAEPTAPVFRPDTRIRWAFAPRKDVREPVALRILAEGPTRRCIAVPEGQRVSATGAIEIEGPIAGVLGLEPGSWTLTAFVGTQASVEAASDPCAPGEAAVMAAGSRQITIVAR